MTTRTKLVTFPVIATLVITATLVAGLLSSVPATAQRYPTLGRNSASSGGSSGSSNITAGGSANMTSSLGSNTTSSGNTTK
jgi:hypothetical protein